MIGEASGFFEVARRPRPTSAGSVELPILYHEVSNVIALFAAPAAAVRDVLGGTGLEPVSAGGGRAVVGLSFYEYRRTSIGPYNEVGVAIFAVRAGEPSGPLGFADLVRPPARRRLAAYVVDLPVTTAAADAAGREIWGYPKFVTGIDFDLAGRRFSGAVRDPAGGDDICRLEGRFGPGVPAPALSLVTYTRLEGALVRTEIDVRGRVTLSTAGSLALRAGRRHPMAERLRALGLDGARPFLALRTTRFQSRLPEGKKLG